jgi:hypothetical protein
MNEYEAQDRYDALNMPRPDPETMCEGECEGTGVYPHKLDDYQTEHERVEWIKAHYAQDAHKDGPCDGWHFISCEDCNGTGKRQV